MIRCDSGAGSEEGGCLRSLDEKRRVYDRNMDMYVYVSVISWDDLCAAGGVSSGGFYFFTVILCSLVNASLHNRPRPCTLKYLRIP